MDGHDCRLAFVTRKSSEYGASCASREESSYTSTQQLPCRWHGEHHFISTSSGSARGALCEAKPRAHCCSTSGKCGYELRVIHRIECQRSQRGEHCSWIGRAGREQKISIACGPALGTCDHAWPPVASDCCSDRASGSRTDNLSVRLSVNYLHLSSSVNAPRETAWCGPDRSVSMSSTARAKMADGAPAIRSPGTFEEGMFDATTRFVCHPPALIPLAPGHAL